MTIKTAIEFVNHLEEAVKASSPEVRPHPGLKIGRKGMQGDCYLHKIKERPACWNVAVRGSQVALGQTIGSRHCADGQGVTVYWPDSKAAAVAQCPVSEITQRIGRAAEFLMGPCVDAPNGFTLTHPEHAHHEFPPGVYFVSYQLDYARQRQVQD